MLPAHETLTWHDMDRPDAVMRVRRRESEDGRWVVLLHGAGMDGTMFDAQISALPTTTGILCPDLRGHGRSPLEGSFRYTDLLADLEAMLAPLAGADVTLIGQSLGGNLAQTWLAHSPREIRRAVLIDCTDNHGPVTRTELLALRSTVPILRRTPWSWTVSASARACGTEPTTQAYARDRLLAIGRERFAEVMGFWRDALRPDPRARLPVPVLALLGERDPTGNIRTAMAHLARRDPQVQLETVAGAAHHANQDRPEAVNTLIAAFPNEGELPAAE